MFSNLSTLASQFQSAISEAALAFDANKDQYLKERIEKDGGAFKEESISPIGLSSNLLGSITKLKQFLPLSDSLPLNGLFVQNLIVMRLYCLGLERLMKTLSKKRFYYFQMYT